MSSIPRNCAIVLRDNFLPRSDPISTIPGIPSQMAAKTPAGFLNCAVWVPVVLMVTVTEASPVESNVTDAGLKVQLIPSSEGGSPPGGIVIPAPVPMTSGHEKAPTVTLAGPANVAGVLPEPPGSTPMGAVRLVTVTLNVAKWVGPTLSIAAIVTI